MATSLTKANTTATNRKKFTFSCWLKRGKLGTQENFFGSIHNGSNEFQFRFDSDDELRWVGSIGGSAAGLLNTKRLFRDTSAWYHIVITGDTTQATNINRLKLYINGTQIADGDFNSPGYPGQDTNFGFGTSDFNFCFGVSTPGTTNDPFTGVISHAHFIDGTAYDASTFGSTDATTGEWKINTSPSVTYGNNGFFILKDGNSVTDQSGNSNNFTVAGGTLTNTEDCPDNVFATLNPLHKTGGTALNALANGNLTYTGHSGTSYSGTYSTLAASSGKYYAEFKCTGGGGAGDMMIGAGTGVTNSTAPGASTEDMVVFGYDGKYYAGSSGVSYGSAITSGDILCVALDLDNNKMYVRKNDSAWFNSGNPTSGSSGTGALTLATSSTGVYHFLIGDYGGDGTPICESNFGNGTFGSTAISSEGTNASGIGKFEYDVPTGYTALSTKGLNE